jgi:hypothetical protein
MIRSWANTLRTLWIQNPTVSYRSAFGIGVVSQVKKLLKKFQLPQAMPEALAFFYFADWERGNREKFLPPRIFRSLVQARGSLPILQESRVQASDPEDTALATFCVATSSNPRTTSQIRDADVCAASEIGWALSTCTRDTIAIKRPKGLSSDWQDLEECARKHLKSS